MTLLQSSMLRNVSQIEGNGRKLSNSVQKKKWCIKTTITTLNEKPMLPSRSRAFCLEPKPTILILTFYCFCWYRGDKIWVKSRSQWNFMEPTQKNDPAPQVCCPGTIRCWDRCLLATELSTGQKHQQDNGCLLFSCNFCTSLCSVTSSMLLWSALRQGPNIFGPTMGPDYKEKIHKQKMAKGVSQLSSFLRVGLISSHNLSGQLF